MSNSPSEPVEIWYSRCGAATASALATRKLTWLDEHQGILTRADSGLREVADPAGKRLALLVAA